MIFVLYTFLDIIVTLNPVVIEQALRMASYLRKLGMGRNKDTLVAADSGSDTNNSTEKNIDVEAKASGNDAQTEAEANRALKELQRKHRWDPNLPSDTREDIDAARHAGDIQSELNLVDALTENSPYPEVRAAVRNVSPDQTRTVHVCR